MPRNAKLALLALVCWGLVSVPVASARGGFGAGGFHAGGGGWHGGVGLGVPGGYYGPSYGDDYEEPWGYGEYAEYGPWAYRGYYGGCYLARRSARDGYGWRLRTVRICS
jgi:hypothetical protein